ncbi:MAG: YdeI/OmpD-associated family protein [Verrucomicrobiota bacterium]
MPLAKLQYFRSAATFRVWLEANHASATELWLGFYKKDSGKGGITYAEALDEALCFGWIDGVKKRVDELRFTQRFTPRRPTSVWSLINVGHVERLTKAGRMKPSGVKAFAARTAAKTGIYSFENRPRELSPELQRQFKLATAAWDFFQQQPPGYRRVASFWVMSAKRDETRTRRFARLISDSKGGRRLGILDNK